MVNQEIILEHYQSAEKLFEKYNSLAKEAMSSGDKTLSENYLQHADHFMRIIEDKNKNQIKIKIIEETAKLQKKKSSSKNKKITQKIKKKKK